MAKAAVEMAMAKAAVEAEQQTTHSPPKFTAPAMLSSVVAAPAVDPTHEPSEAALPATAGGNDAAERSAANQVPNPRGLSLSMALRKPTSTMTPGVSVSEHSLPPHDTASCPKTAGADGARTPQVRLDAGDRADESAANSAWAVIAAEQVVGASPEVVLKLGGGGDSPAWLGAGRTSGAEEVISIGIEVGPPLSVLIAIDRFQFDGATAVRVLFGQMRALTRRQAAWTCAAGACIAVGYLCYFETKNGVPRPVMFAFGCAAGATGMVWGLCYFGEYKGAAARKKALLLLALGLYPSSITLIALSMAP